MSGDKGDWQALVTAYAPNGSRLLLTGLRFSRPWWEVCNGMRACARSCRATTPSLWLKLPQLTCYWSMLVSGRKWKADA